jgi:hypothetical protein
MSFRILGLDPAPFLPLFELGDAELEARQIRRFVADEPHSAPCRVTLEDAVPGERLLLLNHEHQPAATPFRARGPIFVREAARAAFDATGRMPEVFRSRTLSARAYDRQGMMAKGQVTAGEQLAGLLESWFQDGSVDEIHLHFASRGCFAARAVRS